jgi:AcrR family transcriptional regulator
MTESLTERRRRLLRDDIGRVAIDLFTERGFDDVTVDDIAAAVGMSQRTLFRYFLTKDEIVLDLLRRLDRRLLDALDARPPSEGAATALRNAYRSTSHVEPAERARVVQLARILARTPELRARSHGERVDDSQELVTRLARRMGVGPSDRRVRVLATAMSAVAAVEFQRWADAGGRGDPSEVIAAAIDVLAAGLGKLDQIPSTPARGAS